MKRIKGTFQDSPGWTVWCEYKDRFGMHWLGPYPFYPWSYRIEKRQEEKAPCIFNHNGKCEICNCSQVTCSWERYKNRDYTWESEKELNEMFN